MRKAVTIDPKESFARKRKALKIAKRTIKVLTTELGYVANNQNVVDGLATEMTFHWGDRNSRYIYLVFKSIMDKNRKRSPNHEHIRFERVMIKATALKPWENRGDSHVQGEKQVVLEPKALIFTGKTPVSRVKKFHAQLVAGLLT